MDFIIALIWTLMARNYFAIDLIGPLQIWMSNIKFHLIRFICTAHRIDWAPAITDTYQVLLVRDRRTRMSQSRYGPGALFDSVGCGTFPFIKQVEWDNKIWKLQGERDDTDSGPKKEINTIFAWASEGGKQDSGNIKASYCQTRTDEHELEPGAHAEASKYMGINQNKSISSAPLTRQLPMTVACFLSFFLRSTSNPAGFAAIQSRFGCPKAATWLLTLPVQGEWIQAAHSK